MKRRKHRSSKGGLPDPMLKRGEKSTSTAGCPTGKTAFPSRALARRTAKRFRGANGYDGNPYECLICGWWHVGCDRRPNPKPTNGVVG